MFVAVAWYFQPVFFSNSVSFFASRAEAHSPGDEPLLVGPAGARGQAGDFRDATGLLVQRVPVLVEHHRPRRRGLRRESGG
jgi:hypothetical protein